MTTRTGFAGGDLCWTDLQTRDVEATKAFYAAVFGWRYEDLPTPDGRSNANAFVGDGLVAVDAPQNPRQEAARRRHVHHGLVDGTEVAGIAALREHPMPGRRVRRRR